MLNKFSVQICNYVLVKKILLKIVSEKVDRRQS